MFCKTKRNGLQICFCERYQILKKKKDNPDADVGELEREIDEMVYELYGLSEEEIKIIEKYDK